MPLPTYNDIHVNRPLTNVSIAYRQSRTDFVSEFVFPLVRVAKQSDLYYIYNRGDWYRPEAVKRAPGAETAGAGWRMSTDQYYADVWGLHKDVNDQDRANQDQPIDLDRDASEFLMQNMLITKERVFAERFMRSTAWAAGNRWNTALTPFPWMLSTETSHDQVWNSASGPTSDPVRQLRYMIARVKERTGFRPNTLVFDNSAWVSLEDNSEVLQRIQYSERAIVGPDLIKAALRIDNLFIADAVFNSAKEGLTDDVGFINSETNENVPSTSKTGTVTPSTRDFTGLVMGAYVAPNPGILTPSFGYTFGWSGLPGAGDGGVRVKRFRLERNASDRIELEMAFDLRKISEDLGFLMFNVAEVLA